MHYSFLFLIWFTPALIAGMLGWSGIWGTGSAFIEYLIPIPVAGGAFHIPGLIISFVVLRILNNKESPINRFISYAAFSIFIGMLTLHIDFPRFYSWLTTDYQPYGSPIRFESNAVYLFTITDAFWVWLYSLVRGEAFGKPNLLLLLVIPVAVLSYQFLHQKVAGPSFQIGGSVPGLQRGQQIQYIFTTADYNETLLLDWLKDKNYLGTPWMNPNTEHEAIVFTNSMQLIKWGRFDEINNTNSVATVCSYEEDKSQTIHKGLYDCFSGKITTPMRLENLISENPIGFHPWVDYWYARTLLCEDVVIPSDRLRHDIAIYNTCINLSQYFDRDMKKFEESYGKDSNTMKFIRKHAKEVSLPRTIPSIQ